MTDPIDAIRNTSDNVLSTEFIDAYSKEVRYVGEWGRWMAYDGIKWDIDKKLSIFTRARAYVNTVALDLHRSIVERMNASIDKNLTSDQKALVVQENKAKALGRTKSIQSASTIYNIVSLSRSDKRVAADVNQWDHDPWMLNTPSGSINLKTGSTRPHKATDYARKVTMVSPDYKMQPTQWLTFLRKIMRNDEGMVRYLQKVFGYCLVGETKEHQMYFAYGTGANGKGVTLNTLRSLLGSYGMEAAVQTFMINENDRHPTELADLHGARLVTCGETEKGQRWAEARIKLLTGGDPVKARFMREDFFQYTPQYKLFLAGNHKPKLTNVDEAIKRRFRLIPFTVTIPKPERDTDLFQKLKPEWPAIMAWAIDGCLAWQAEGLEPPTAVAEATSGYLDQEDALNSWFKECCEHDEGSRVGLDELYKSWRTWALDNGADPGTKRTLTRDLEDREPVMNIQKVRMNSGFAFKGMAMLKMDADA